MIDQYVDALGRALPMLGPYMVVALFLLIVQTVAIKRIDNRKKRTQLLTYSIYIQMAMVLTFAGMSLLSSLKE